MRDSAHMPQLKEDSAAALMNGFDDPAPRSHLFGGINSWSIDVPLAHGRDLRGLGHDEPSRSALRIISRRKFARDAICACAVARKGRHEDAICQDQRSKLNRFEKGCHFVLQLFYDVVAAGGKQVGKNSPRGDTPASLSDRKWLGSNSVIESAFRSSSLLAAPSRQQMQ